ncbi:MAG: hypothetical protein L0Y42_06120 [Phycisphaerales bacterium]|nr:hypothetical protein [Phycisphaerales bacterium]
MKSESQLRLLAAAVVLLALGPRALHAQQSDEGAGRNAVPSATPSRATSAPIASDSSYVSFDLVPAAEPALAAVADPDAWWFQPSLAIWAPSIDGTVGARGLTTDVSVSFTDILEDADSVIGISGTFEMGTGKWSGFVAGMYTKIGVDEPTPFGTAELDTELALLSFGIAYEVGRWPMETASRADQPARDGKVDVYAGGRYTSVGIDFDFAVLPTIDHDKDWVDPIIGAALDLPFSPNWSVVLDGSVGGFGVSSDFVWAASGLLSWDFYIGSSPSSLQFGYLAVGDDYSSGSGTDQFVWDTILHGLVINWAIRF